MFSLLFLHPNHVENPNEIIKLSYSNDEGEENPNEIIKLSYSNDEGEEEEADSHVESAI